MHDNFNFPINTLSTSESNLDWNFNFFYFFIYVHLLLDCTDRGIHDNKYIIDNKYTITLLTFRRRQFFEYFECSIRRCAVWNRENMENKKTVSLVNFKKVFRKL